MSVSNDIESLRDLTAASEGKRAELEAKTRASKLMREAAGLLLALPSSDPTTLAAAKLVEACEALAGPPDAQEATE